MVVLGVTVASVGVLLVLLVFGYCRARGAHVRYRRDRCVRGCVVDCVGVCVVPRLVGG